jgi:hypothetical protein
LREDCREDFIHDTIAFLKSRQKNSWQKPCKQAK